MADTIIDGTQFDVQNIKYSNPKANAAGGKSVNILNKLTNSGLRISTPILLTWGASDFENNQKYDMSLQFPRDEYKNADTEAFLNNLIAFENKIKADALVYSKEWFGKQHKSPEVVDALWSPMLKYSRNKETGEPDCKKAPTIRVKIPVWEGVWRCEIYDEEDNKLFPNSENPAATPLEFLQKGTNVACLLQCGGLWFANGKFGLTWKLVQAVVQKPRASLTGKCFIKLKASEKDKLKTQAPPPVVEDVETPTALVEDSDEENDDDEDETPAPSPAPTPAPVPPPPPTPQVEEIAATAQTSTAVAVEATSDSTIVKKKVVKKKVVA
jgi:hypothetical protein